MQFLVGVVLLARSIVDLARSVVEAHSARRVEGRYVPKHLGRRRGGRTQKEKDR